MDNEMAVSEAQTENNEVKETTKTSKTYDSFSSFLEDSAEYKLAIEMIEDGFYDFNY